MHRSALLQRQSCPFRQYAQGKRAQAVVRCSQSRHIHSAESSVSQSVTNATASPNTLQSSALVVLAAATSFLAAAPTAHALQNSFFDLPGFGAAQPSSVEPRQYVDEEERYDEYLLTPEIKEFLQLLETGKYDAAKLEQARERVNFQRDLTGLVSLKSREGNLYHIKNDMMAPGFLLLQDSFGKCFYLPPDTQGGIVQVDLSDDAVVAQLFANTAWQDVMAPVMVYDSAGIPQQLQMTPYEFRTSLTFLGQGFEGFPLEEEDDADTSASQ